MDFVDSAGRQVLVEVVGQGVLLLLLRRLLLLLLLRRHPSRPHWGPVAVVQLEVRHLEVLLLLRQPMLLLVDSIDAPWMHLESCKLVLMQESHPRIGESEGPVVAAVVVVLGIGLH